MASASPDSDRIQRTMLYRLHDDLERTDRRLMLVVSASVLLIGLCLPMFVVDVTGRDGTTVGWLPDVTGANGWAVLVIALGLGLVVATFAAAAAPGPGLLLGCALAAGLLLITALLVVAGVGSSEPTGMYGEIAYSVTLGVCPMIAGAVLTGVSAMRARSAFGV